MTSELDFPGAAAAMARALPTAAEAAANLQVNFAAAGISAAELMRRDGIRPAPCHRCGTDATVQWPRQATEAEREAHWDAQEQHIRSIPDLYGGQNDSYVADRTDSVVKAVFGCDDHQVDGMTVVHAADCGGHGACACGGEA